MKLQLELTGQETATEVDHAHRVIDEFCGRVSPKGAPLAVKAKRKRRSSGTAHIMPTPEERAKLAPTDRAAARELADQHRGLKQ